MIVTGNPETKDLKDMVESLKQFGPHQISYLKTLAGGADVVKEASKQAEDDEDDIPDLIGTNFEEASKQK